MISHAHRCIFLHIPKCAGTSVETALGHLDGHAGRDGQDHRPLRFLETPVPLQAFFGIDNLRIMKNRIRRPRPAANPRNLLTVTPEQYARYFKFPIVRNPWDRLYSVYCNVARDPVHRRSMGIGEMPPLLDFLRDNQGRMLLLPQTYWLKDFRGRVRLDFIGRTADGVCQRRFGARPCEAVAVIPCITSDRCPRARQVTRSPAAELDRPPRYERQSPTQLAKSTSGGVDE